MQCRYPGRVLKAASCGCGAAIIAVGVFHLITLSLDVPGAVRNAYFIVFGALLILAEFSHLAKVQWMLKYLSLLTTFTGRGIFCLYIASILFELTHPENLIISIALAANGVFNVALGCVQKDAQENPWMDSTKADQVPPIAGSAGADPLMNDRAFP